MLKFRTFLIIFCIVAVGFIVGAGFLVKSLFSGGSSSVKSTQTVSSQSSEAQLPVNGVAGVDTNALKTQIDQWLNDHYDRQGKNRVVDILPQQRFKATAIRFSEADAVKWSNDSRQWSQIKFDLDRDGRDDEKWLLKNGHTYKRETLDTNGRVVFTEYFK